jgi:hypothetical protein
MTDGKPTEGTAEQVQPLTEEARVARLEAKEAIDRIQQRIERLVLLSKPLDEPEGDDDARETSVRERELAVPACSPD